MGGFGSPGNEARLFRYTVGKWSKEFGWGIFLWITLWRLTKWVSKHGYVFARHPTAMAITAGMLILWIINPLIPLITAMVLYLAAWEVWVRFPHWHRRHVTPRAHGLLRGLKYRWRLRHKLKACGLIDNEDPTPIPIRTRVHGCTTTVLLKMVRGQELEWYRLRSPRIAQTFNALECKANPYRIGKRTLPQYVQLELLSKDPFTSNLGPEYIDFHSQPDTFTPAIATLRSGKPQNDNLAAHKLAIAMTRWGKSSRIRARIYANRDKIRKRELELWGIDGKGGIEHSFLEHAFAYVAYGDSELNKNAYNPSEFDRLLKAAVRVMKKRQRGMRGEVTEHTPTPDQPWLLIMIDEILVLTNKAVLPELRTSIAASINLILQQGIACGVSIDASTQLATKDNLDPINRGGFTEYEIGKVERGVVDMIFGTGWWERGAKADEIPEDLKGVFYKKTESTMVPEQIRYPWIPVSAVTPKALGFTVGQSAFKRHLEAVPDSEPEPASPPEPEPEPEIIGHIDDKPIQLIAGAAEQPPVKSESKTIPPHWGGFA
jgi:DNA segregation ATPase FtsK/SpoIIIE, S-DNA-T family